MASPERTSGSDRTHAPSCISRSPTSSAVGGAAGTSVAACVSSTSTSRSSREDAVRRSEACIMHTALQWLIHFGSTRAIQVWHSLKRVCPDVHQSLAKADDFGSALLSLVQQHRLPLTREAMEPTRRLEALTRPERPRRQCSGVRGNLPFVSKKHYQQHFL